MFDSPAHDKRCLDLPDTGRKHCTSNCYHWNILHHNFQYRHLPCLLLNCTIFEMFQSYLLRLKIGDVLCRKVNFSRIGKAIAD
jgi:hypothetical protein